MQTLKSLQNEIERLQAQFRETASLNAGVIRGAIDTSALSERIQVLMTEYNARAKRTMYEFGRIVSRR